MDLHIVICITCILFGLIGGVIVSSTKYRDLSKQSSFIGSFTSIGHVLVGLCAGLLIYHANYPFDSDVLYTTRRMAGLLVIVLFTYRNFKKHPDSTDRKLHECKMQSSRNRLLRSSFTRQQMQLAIGVGIGGLLARLVGDDPIESSLYKMAPLWGVAGLTVFTLGAQVTAGGEIDNNLLNSCFRVNTEI